MRRKADKALVVDVESTCWEGFPPPGERSEIIEIGVVPVDLRTHEIGEGESIYVYPEHSTVSDYCTDLTGITVKTLKDKGIKYVDAIRKLTEEYDSRQYTMISWGDYDRNMFWKMADLYMADYPFPPTHINLKYFFAMWIGMVNMIGLRKALEKLGMEFEGVQHCGRDDAYNTARIFAAMLKSFKPIQDMSHGKNHAEWIGRKKEAE